MRFLRPACVATVWFATALECPDERWHKIGDRCFRLSDTKHSFEACQRDVCGPAGGALACVREEEARWLSEQFFDWTLEAGEDEDTSPHDMFAAWIGFSDAGSEGSWTWMTGCGSKETNWLPGEPNNYCGGEDCAAMTRGGWVDLSCRVSVPCLCEFPATASAEYQRSIAGLRDDSCYGTCDHNSWCRAWPFVPAKVSESGDVCSWEREGGPGGSDEGLDDEDEQAWARFEGRSVGECAARARARPECGQFFSYWAGHCQCAPRSGPHANCTNRVPEESADIFVFDGDGLLMVSSGERCAYTESVDNDYFALLQPEAASSFAAAHWMKAAAVWLAAGVPSVLLAACVLACMCRPAMEDEARAWQGKPPESEVGSYGPLLDHGDSTASDTVNRWVVRGAIGAIVYAVALLSLGATLALHVSGADFGFEVDLVESLVMAFGQMAVGISAHVVHHRLSEFAREAAGRWLVVFALSKLMIAAAALCLAFVFATLARFGETLRDYWTLCFAAYLFRWSMLLSTPLQCLSGLALWRIQVRAQRYAGTGANVDGWVVVLVVGNFAAGAGTWAAGFLSTVMEAGYAVAPCFILAAASQLAAGVATLVINGKLKVIFGGGGSATEMTGVSGSEAIGRTEAPGIVL